MRIRKLFLPLVVSMLSTCALGQGLNPAKYVSSGVAEQYRSNSNRGGMSTAGFSGIAKGYYPLFSENFGSLNVDIGLSYYSSGVKVAEPSTSLGEGWSLSFGGSISREINGEPDIFPNADCQYYGEEEFQEPIICSSIFSGLLKGAVDGVSDTYYMNYGQYQSTFIFDENGEVQILSGNRDISIEILMESELWVGFKCKLPNGVILEYKVSRFEDYYNHSFIGDNYFHGSKYYEFLKKSESQFSRIPSSWQLVSVSDPITGDEYKVEYEEYELTTHVEDHYQSFFNGLVDYYDSNNPDAEILSLNAPNQGSNESYSNYLQRVRGFKWYPNKGKANYGYGYEEIATDIDKKIMLPTKISMGGKEIRFNYENIGFYQYNPFRVLKSILVKESGSDHYEYLLDYSESQNKVFLSSVELKSHPTSGDSETLEGLKFDYFESPNGANLSPLSIDVWGLQNGFVGNNSYIVDYTLNSPYIEQSGNGRAPNLSYAKIGMLKSVENAFGGKTFFDYEFNERLLSIEEQTSKPKVAESGMNIYTSPGSNNYTPIGEDKIFNPLEYKDEIRFRVFHMCGLDPSGIPYTYNPLNDLSLEFCSESSNGIRRVVAGEFWIPSGSQNVSLLTEVIEEITRYNQQWPGREKILVLWSTKKTGVARYNGVNGLNGGLRLKSVSESIPGSSEVSTTTYTYNDPLDASKSSGKSSPNQSYGMPNSNMGIGHGTYYSSIQTHFPNGSEKVDYFYGMDEEEFEAANYEIDADYNIYYGNEVRMQGYLSTDFSVFGRPFYGKMSKTQFFDNLDIPYREVNYQYELINNGISFAYEEMHIGKLIGNDTKDNDGNYRFTGVAPATDVELTGVGKELSLSKVVETSIESGTEMVSSKLSFYDSPHHSYVTRTQQSTLDGDVFESVYRYPQDFPSSGNASLVALIADNRVSIPIERIQLLNGKVISASYSEYGQYGDHTLLSATYSFESKQPIVGTSEDFFENGLCQSEEAIPDYYRQQSLIEAYNGKGIPSKIIKNDGTILLNVFDNNGDNIIGAFVNQSESKLKLATFEGGFTPYGMSYPASALVGGVGSQAGHTGSTYFNLSSSNLVLSTLPVNEPLNLAFWYRGAKPIISGAHTVLLDGSENVDLANGWKLFYVKINCTSSQLTIQGSAQIDDVIVTEEQASFTLFNYDGFQQLTSTINSNYFTSYFYYDSFGRKSYIKDDRGNIVETYERNY